jgi:hypothetical protein
MKVRHYATKIMNKDGMQRSLTLSVKILASVSPSPHTLCAIVIVFI